MANPGPKELQTAALRLAKFSDIPTKFLRGHPDCIVKDTPQPKTKRSPARNAGVTLAPPLSIQKAIAADLKNEPKPTAKPEAKQADHTMTKTATKKTTTAKKPAAKKTATASKTKATQTASKSVGAKEVRPGSKLEIIVGMLKRKEGCTAAEVLTATGWPAVSMPQQAKAAGIKLKTEKTGRQTRYWADLSA